MFGRPLPTVFGLLAIATILNGCGLVIKNAQNGMVHQTVSVTDRSGVAIPDAELFADADSIGKTDRFGVVRHEIDAPEKGDSFRLKTVKAGWKTDEREVKAIVDPGFLTGDIFLGVALCVLPVIITVAVDATSDGWLAYPRFINVQMEPAATADPEINTGGDADSARPGPKKTKDRSRRGSSGK